MQCHRNIHPRRECCQYSLEVSLLRPYWPWQELNSQSTTVSMNFYETTEFGSGAEVLTKDDDVEGV